ncbi:unnamed protein product [Heligmosomoides polygyrus]|uniref:Uncharacterized protein n=1 Tax=Heligmosomoides polygyrus TaxID=6339 RepID=A0A3P7YGF5_HELPZ|nr:unnamed protein product [Heligmosomoides polygyrus]
MSSLSLGTIVRTLETPKVEERHLRSTRCSEVLAVGINTLPLSIVWEIRVTGESVKFRFVIASGR